ncbi:hypothetical protein AVEN_83449-1 [Araneus ventricosus]|uniref:Uncharacterized protein n=1 Tax=Araneus ventricosus TaxID=182803 RepID=A0A4Y2M0W4_ARAVE|nr:hypothetical protein AVEN_83449-1 [Araneus ventricosus]
MCCKEDPSLQRVKVYSSTVSLFSRWRRKVYLSSSLRVDILRFIGRCWLDMLEWLKLLGVCVVSSPSSPPASAGDRYERSNARYLLPRNGEETLLFF